MSNTSFVGSTYDLAKILKSEGIKNILSILCRCYFKLCEDKKINNNMIETKITEELFVKIQTIFRDESSSFKLKEMNIIPMTSKPVGASRPKKGKFPEIDICFRHEIESESFFGIECKILDDNKKNKYSLYMSQGVQRYLTRKYVSNCSHSSMIAYVLNGNLSVVINEIKKRIQKNNHVLPLTKSFNLDQFDKHYQSKHDVPNYHSDFVLHHLFFDFT